jgi:hypothetical protein
LNLACDSHGELCHKEDVLGNLFWKKKSEIQNAGKETKNLVVGNLIFAEFPDIFFSGGSWFLQLHPGTDSFSILSIKKKKTNKQTTRSVFQLCTLRQHSPMHQGLQQLTHPLLVQTKKSQVFH